LNKNIVFESGSILQIFMQVNTIQNVH